MAQMKECVCGFYDEPQDKGCLPHFEKQVYETHLILLWFHQIEQRRLIQKQQNYHLPDHLIFKFFFNYPIISRILPHPNNRGLLETTNIVISFFVFRAKDMEFAFKKKQCKEKDEN
jgi:hypothetical protein